MIVRLEIDTLVDLNPWERKVLLALAGEDAPKLVGGTVTITAPLGTKVTGVRSKREVKDALSEPAPEPAPEPTPEPAPEPAPDPAPEVEVAKEEPEQQPTMQDAVKVATELVSSGKTAAVKAVLAEIGVKRVSELKGEAIATFVGTPEIWEARKTAAATA